MNKNRLKLYYISDNYVDYMRQFDDKIRYNKKGTRPYVGIVYEHNNRYYFAPLASPKPKHKKMDKKALDIWLIDNGDLGIINFNNMLPSPLSELKEIMPIVTDIKYKKLLENQISSINKDRYLIMKKVERFYYQYKNNRLSESITKRCCNFAILEDKSEKYKEQMKEKI